MDAEQSAAVAADSACVLVFACPGSGKTRVLTRRAQRLSAQGSKVVCLSFTNQAADEMRRRLASDVAVKCGTMHSWAKEMLETSISGQALRILDATEQRRVFGDLGAVGHAFDAAVRAYGLQSAQSPTRSYEGPCRQLLEDYDAAKRAAGVVDFEDLLTGLFSLLGAEMPPEVPRHVLVDEFQDLNLTQISILRRLKDLGTSVFCVGDGNQAIYGFRGATPDCMGRFEELMGDHAALRLQLHRNYRSCSGVVDLCSQHAGVRMVSCTASPTNRLPELHLFSCAADEAAWLRQQPTPGVMLFRTNAQLRAMEADFLQSGVCFEILGAPKIQEQEVWGCLRSAVSDDFDGQVWDAGEVGPDDVIERLPVPQEEARAARPLIRRVCKLPHSEAMALLDRSAVSGSAAAPWLLSTAHQAKGMEWPTVHIPNMTEGQFPLRVQSSEEAEEERRIFFVAASRAMHGLVMSSAGERPSEFVRCTPLGQVTDHRTKKDAAPGKAKGLPPTATFKRKSKTIRRQ